MQIVDGNRIQTVTLQGVIYLDDEGVEQFIDFAQCYENYLADRLSPETWERIKSANQKTDDDWNDWVERTKRFKYVGDRNILTPPWADGPYIEFYTTPMIRFKFATEREFQVVRNAIEKARYRTGDHS